MGEGFGPSLWLVTRVVTATRKKVDDQVLTSRNTISISIKSISIIIVIIMISIYTISII